MTSRLLQPDYDDESATILPSFASLRRRTLDTLYPAAAAISRTNKSDHEGPVRVDKSPKGSVDEHIQSLVDLINRHPSFSTLSSCSGRISLFDPNLRHGQALKSSEDPADSTERAQPDEAEVSAVDDILEGSGSRTKSASGKGGAGGWLFVSHDEIDDPQKIVNLLDDNQTPENDDEKCAQNGGALLAFKVEPMLLHVAAASLERGQQLLQVALRTGFRESGFVVTASRVTVAIRSHSLALHVPLSSRPGPMRPSNDYLISLVGEANRRLRANLRRIGALYDEIESSLFRPSSETISAADNPRPVRNPCSICATRLPNLNLWGQTTVAVSVPNGPECWTLLAFGGYGDGPESQASDSLASHQRSGSVFRLQLSSSGAWRPTWERLETRLGDTGTRGALNLDVEAIDFGPREGLASCVIAQPDSELTSSHSTPALIMLFGGRTSPTKPLHELLFCQYWQSLTCVTFVKPTDVRGQPPSPRWGHTVTPLTNVPSYENKRRLAVVFGGRNETEALDSMHVISLISEEGESKCHLVWESVVLSGIQCPMRRFHHEAVLLNDRLFVLGGLESTSDLLEPLRQTSPFDARPAVMGLSMILASDSITAIASVVKGDESCLAQLRRFGHRAGVLDVRSDEAIVVLTGGVPVSNHDDDEEDSPPRQVVFLRVSLEPGKDAKVQVLRDVESASHDESFDLGTLVHHDACVLLSSVGGDRDTATLVVVGGGVPGFGFRPCFANSHAFTIAFTPAPEAAPRVDTTDIPSSRAAPAEPTPNVGAQPANGSVAIAVAIAVAHVRQLDAKSFKEWLDGRGWLDKRYRIAPAARPTAEEEEHGRDGAVAVPMTPDGWEAYYAFERCREARTNEESMFSAMVGRGMQALPRSTRTYARHPPPAAKK